MMERVKRIPPIAPIAFLLVISAISYVKKAGCLLGDRVCVVPVLKWRSWECC
jgi:hypothetical protein